MIPQFKAVIVDDEPKSIELLKDILDEMYPSIHINSVHTNWNSAWKELRLNQTELLFLDISMPEKSGFDLLSSLPDLKCEIVFVTAHSEFAFQSYKFTPAGYLLKPVDEVMLEQVLPKILKRIEQKRITESQFVNPVNTIKIGIPNIKGTDFLSPDDIYYLEAINSCTKVVSKFGEITSSYNLGKFKSIVEKYNFITVHRSYIVNFNKVVRYSSVGTLILDNNAEIPISKNFKDEFLTKFEKISKQ